MRAGVQDLFCQNLGVQEFLCKMEVNSLDAYARGVLGKMEGEVNS